MSMLSARCDELRDATHGTLTAEQVMAIAGRHQPDYCSDTHVCFDWQAISDELNATITSRAERTCKPLGTIRYDYEGGYPEYETELSCGHKWRDGFGDYPKYCPNCGARVVGGDAE